MRRIVPLVLAGSLLFAACGGDDDTAAANDSIVLPAKESAATEPAADTTTPATVSPPSVVDAPAGSVGGPLVTPIELDPCLVGTWNMSDETIVLVIGAILFAIPDITLVDGGFTVTLNDDGTIAAAADFTTAFTLGEDPAESDVSWTGSGTWTSFDGNVSLALDEQNGGVTEVRIDGVAPSNGGVENEVGELDLPLAGGPYTCTDTRLDVTGTAGGTTLPLVFER